MFLGLFTLVAPKPLTLDPLRASAMENSWRFRPVQASLCPVCSAPHFPFCPPLPHLAAVEIHRRFPPPDLYYAPAAPPMPPMPPPPTFHPPLPPHRFLNDEFLERESFRKRMRVEDPMMMLAFDRTADDERRLNLIRSHGQQQSNGFEASWDDHQRSFHDPRLSSNGGIGHQTRSFSEIPDSHGIDRLVYQERKDLLSGEFDSHKSGPVDPYGRMEQFDGSWQPSRSFRAGEYAESSNNYAARPVLDSVPGFWHENSPCFLPIEDSSRFLPKQSQYDGVQKSHGSMQHSVENRIENQHSEVMRAPFEFKPPIAEQILRPLKSQSYPIVEQSKQGGYLPLSDDGNGHGMCTVMTSGVHTSQTYPPLPPQPPLPPYPELPPLHLPVTTAVQTSHFATTTVMDSTSATMRPPLSDQVSPGHYPFPRANLYNEPHVHTSTGFATEGLPSIHETLSKDYLEDRRQTFPLKHSLKDKPTTVDACQLFRQPHRASRPDHIVVILRGLPGSGKSYLAKALRDLEVENGGKAPPIHAMDDYSMIEVEKKVSESLFYVEDNEVSKFSGSSRGKKQISKKVIKYCYEPEMQEAYRSSMLKAFKKTMDEGIFTFIIEIGL